MLTQNDLRSSLAIARTNWAYWCDVYEHRGPIQKSPLFAENGRFAKFCKEYSVHRTIRAGAQDLFRQTLAAKLPTAVEDDSGRGLDRLEAELRPRFGTRNGSRSMISAFSKVAAFVKPERFIAWDRYARGGLNRINGRTSSTPFASYEQYLRSIDDVWNGELGDGIRQYLAQNSEHAIERELRFQRRVLDVALMKLGGRQMSETW